MANDINSYKYPNNNIPANFQGAAIEQIKEGGSTNSVLKSMDLPSTPDEFVKFSPYATAGAVTGFSFLKLANWLNFGNPEKTKTLEKAFSESKMTKWGESFKFLNPLTDFVENTWKKIKPTHTPDFAKHIQTGVRPEWSMAKTQLAGMSAQAADGLISTIEQLPNIKTPEIENILRSLKAEKITSTRAAEKILKIINPKSIENLTFTLDRILPIPFTNGIKIGTRTVNVAKIASKVKGFLGKGAENPIAKGLQKLTMGTSEAVGGAVVGGTFGIVLNAFFLGTAFKKAANAPKGEKISTFMESFWGDFVGYFLVMFPASKFLYKSLGIKNLDKTPTQVKEYTKKLNNINWIKNYNEIINNISTNGVTSDILKEINEKLKIAHNLEGKSKEELIEFLGKKFGKINPNNMYINTLIDELKAIKSNLKFTEKPLQWLIKKPLSIIGKFFSTGLEMVPTKIADEATKVSKLKEILGKLKNTGKGGFGAILRFALLMFVITPPLRNLCIKASHLVFGRPTKSLLDEEKEDGTQKDAAKIATEKMSMNDFLKYTNKPVTADLKATTPIMQTQTPALKTIQPTSPQQTAAVGLDKTEEPANDKNRSYVPSSEATKFTKSDTTKLDAAISSSDKWEKYAEKTLKEI